MEKPPGQPENPEQAYINELHSTCRKIVDAYPQESQKKRLLEDAFRTVINELSAKEDVELNERRRAILKLKLARYFKKHDTYFGGAIADAISQNQEFIDQDRGELEVFLERHRRQDGKAMVLRNSGEEPEDRTSKLSKALYKTQSGDYFMTRVPDNLHSQRKIEAFLIYKNPNSGSKDPSLIADEPVVTIEYNPKTKRIVNIEGQNMSRVRTDDLFLEDMIDALRLLTETRTDTGEPRIINGINPEALEEIEVRADHALAAEGVLAMSAIDPKNKPFILKAGRITTTNPNELAHIANIFLPTEQLYTGSHIAKSDADITSDTKVYIGPFTPGIFAKLAHVPHIFTPESFPQNPFERIELGIIEPQSPGAILNELTRRKQVGEIQLGFYTHLLLEKDSGANPDFKQLEAPENISLIKLTAADIGSPDKDALVEAIYTKAQELGLELCPHQAAFYHLLGDRDQIFVGMETIRDHNNVPRFFMQHVDLLVSGGPWHFSDCGTTWPNGAAHPVPTNTQWVFRIPDDSKEGDSTDT